MNKLSKVVTLPILLGSLVGFWLLMTNQVSWFMPLICYFLFGVIFNGTIAHRYFTHNSFWVPAPVRKLFGILVVLGGYGAPISWIILHKQHHLYTDRDNDVHAPSHGLWHAFIGWRSTLDSNNSFGTLNQYKKNLRDPTIKFTTRHYLKIIWIWILCLLIIDWKFCLAGYCVGLIIEYIKLGLINTVCHIPGLPGNYTNHLTKDKSQNNIFLGLLGFGFGWHNNHHKNANKLILTEKWWEIDIEGYIGWIIGRIFQPFKR